MYFNEHFPPHFHAQYGGEEASYILDSLEVYEGQLPRRVNALVLEWAALHRKELKENWEKAKQGRELSDIEPLE